MSGDLLAVAQLAARAAAGLIRTAGDVSVAATKSSEVDPVTQVDRDSEALIRAVIRSQRPDDAFLGEEGEDEPGSTGVRWIIDPIDGTVNFLYGLAEFAVSIAAERDGTAVAGVVLNVPRNVEYTAVRSETGVQSWRNGTAIAVRRPDGLATSLVATGFSYDRDLRQAQGRALAGLIGHVRDIRRNGSAALELCHVAEGALDGYFEEGVHLWDFAAGALIAEGAGARFEVGVGQAGRDLAVCATPEVFDALWSAIRTAGFTAQGGVTSRE